MLQIILTLIALLGQCACSTPAATQPPAPSAPTAPHGLVIAGNHFTDTAGITVKLVGATRSTLEYHCQGDQHFTPADFAAMKSWGMNVVRLPLSEPFWLNSSLCPTYRQTVADAVRNAENAGFYVVLTLAWISPFNAGHNPAGAGYPMADAQSPAFWTSVAGQYATDPNVLFEMYSEPHDIDWNTWLHGGSVTVVGDTDRVAGTYQAVGMQQLADAARQAAPNRIVLVGGNQWSGDLTNVTQGDSVQGSNVAYDIHFYPGPHSSDPANWPSRFGNLAQTTPVVATEFGQLDCGSDFLAQALPYMAQHLAGMIAWTWNMGSCKRPALITGWDGTPTAYGAYIRDFYLGLNH